MTYSTIDKGDPHVLVSIKCFCFHLMCVAAAKSNMNTQKLILNKNIEHPPKCSWNGVSPLLLEANRKPTEPKEENRVRGGPVFFFVCGDLNGTCFN